MEKLSRSQNNALRRMTITGPQAHDPSFYNGTLRGASKMPEWMYGIGQKNNAGVGGGSAALNSGMALNVETGKQEGMKKGGAVKKAKPKCMARGGGCEVRGKTKGRFV